MDFKFEAYKKFVAFFNKVKQELKDAKLVDGTIVSAEEFEPGQELFVITEEGERLPAPDGEHTLESGQIVVVAEGKILEIKDKVEEEMKEEDKDKEEMKKEEDEEKKEYLQISDEDKTSIVSEVMQILEERFKKIEDALGINESELTKLSEEREVLKETINEVVENFSKIPAVEKTNVQKLSKDIKVEEMTAFQKYWFFKKGEII
jgi:hypothetical protein